RQQQSELTGLGLVAEVVPRVLAEPVEPGLDRRGRPENRQVRVALLRDPADRLAAAEPRHPDRRVRLLERPRPDVDVVEAVVLPGPAKRRLARPGGHDQVVAAWTRESPFRWAGK